MVVRSDIVGHLALPDVYPCPGAKGFPLPHPGHAPTAKRCLDPACGFAWLSCPGFWDDHAKDGCRGCGGVYWTEVVI